jgi:hypothetical protein
MTCDKSLSARLPTFHHTIPKDEKKEGNSSGSSGMNRFGRSGVVRGCSKNSANYKITN